MTPNAYAGAREICDIHAQRLRWAMTRLQPQRPLTAEKLAALDPVELAVCDQFVTRFGKL
jgi:hypothetical protein